MGAILVKSTVNSITDYTYTKIAIRAACESFSVSEQDLFSEKTRPNTLVEIRVAITAILRKHKVCVTSIAFYMQREKSGIYKNVKKHSDWLHSSPPYRSVYNTLSKKFELAMKQRGAWAQFAPGAPVILNTYYFPKPSNPTQ